jgi:hypothetical protein
MAKKKSGELQKQNGGRHPEIDANMLAEKLLVYIKEKCESPKEYPILAEFAYQQDILRERMYEIAETKNGGRLSYAIKKCSQAKEFRLESLCSRNKINPSMAIFSLKQLGWKDNKDQAPSDPTEALNKIAAAMLPK